MAARRGKSARLLAAASAAGLQVVLIRLLLLGTEPSAMQPVPPLAAVTVLIPVSLLPSLRSRGRRPGGSAGQHYMIPRRARAAKPPAVQRIVQRLPAIHARAHVDWLQAIRSESRSLEFRSVIKPEVRSGFPQVLTPISRATHFGWDYASTHRIQELPSGGIVVMINDRCAIEFDPLPIIGCALGKINVKGDLFKHMNDRQNPGPRLPP